MPLYKSIQLNSQTSVKIWKIEESFESLLNPLTLTELSKNRVEGMKSEVHARGFLSVRHLLKEFGYTDDQLTYNDHGKPFLNDGKQVSITHSNNFSAVIIGNTPNGIDIEKQRPKIENIAGKFIDYENHWMQMYKEDKIIQLSMIWCVKESLYKLYAQPGLSFKNHCMVIPFSIEDNQTKCWIDINEKRLDYHAHLMNFEGFSCAYISE